MLDLYIHRHYLPNPERYFVDCYWLVNKSKKLPCNSLIEIYLRTSSHILDLTSPEQLRRTAGPIDPEEAE